MKYSDGWMVAARTPGIAPESDSADGIRDFLTIT
jgi:hypothetical protein